MKGADYFYSCLFRSSLEFKLINYYEILGLQGGASLQEIKKAYKELVKKWHRDFHPNNPQCLEKIKEINEAYGILSHSEKRRAYHQQGKEREIIYYRRMAYASHENHPFFSYFMRFDNLTWMKEWLEKDSKKGEK